MMNASVIAIALLAGIQPSDLLPSAARRAVDREFSAWRIAPTSERVAGRFKAAPMAPSPNVLVGDFDGNGQRDYALLIQYAAPGQEQRVQLIALLQRGSEIGLHYDCCGCRTFLFRGGQFRSIWTCD